MSSEDKIKGLQDALSAAIAAGMPPELKARGWEYRDVPGLCTPEAWDSLLALIGHGEYQIVAVTSGVNKNGPFKRGQLFISPKGFENMKQSLRKH